MLTWRALRINRKRRPLCPAYADADFEAPNVDDQQQYIVGWKIGANTVDLVFIALGSATLVLFGVNAVLNRPARLERAQSASGARASSDKPMGSC